MELKGRTKFERWKELGEAGLNIPDFVTVENQKDLLTIRNFIRRNPRISVRTYRSNKAWYKTVHKPNLPRKEAVQVARELLNAGYSVSMAQGIDPKNTIVCGTVLKQKAPDNTVEYIFEVVFGPGTVRRVMVDGEVEARWTINQEHGDEQQGIKNYITDAIMLMLKNFPENTIFEWSYYANPVGKQRGNLIFWEWLPAGGEK